MVLTLFFCAWNRSNTKSTKPETLGEPRANLLQRFASASGVHEGGATLAGFVVAFCFLLFGYDMSHVSVSLWPSAAVRRQQFNV